MVGFTIIAGALISLGIGWIASEFVFGRTSNAGYHGRSGRLKTKGQGTQLRLMKILAMGAVALMLTGSVAGVLASFGPVGALAIAFIAVFLYHHLEIDQWKLV